MSSNTFCPCNDYACEFNPSNHDKGCNLCIEDSLKTKEIQKCFFKTVRENLDDVTDWSYETFAYFVLNAEEK